MALSAFFLFLGILHILVPFLFSNFEVSIINTNCSFVFSESILMGPSSQVSTLTEKDGRSSLSSFRIKMQPTIEQFDEDHADSNYMNKSQNEELVRK